MPVCVCAGSQGSLHGHVRATGVSMSILGMDSCDPGCAYCGKQSLDYSMAVLASEAPSSGSDQSSSKIYYSKSTISCPIEKAGYSCFANTCRSWTSPACLKAIHCTSESPK